MPSVPSLPPAPPWKPAPLRLWKVHRRGMLNFLSDLARQHGDFVRLHVGRPMCLVTDPEAIRKILVTDAGKFVKSHVLKGTKQTLGDGLLTSDGELHKTQRKLIAPAFHAQKVKAYADDFVAQATRMADGWRSGQTLDVGHAMTELTLRVVTRSLFGTEIEEDIAPIGHDMETIIKMFERTRSPLAGLLNALPLPANRRFKAAVRRLDERVLGMIEARKAAGTEDRFDFLSLLLMAHGEGGSMSRQQVRDEAVTLFMAGHETTANALIWTWLLLAEHPDVERTMHAELDRVLAGRAPTADDVMRLKYTRAVVAESMRLRPPAWIIARLCGEPYDVGPYRVPAGTTLLMPQFIVHRDPRWWPDAEAFKPERWLADTADRVPADTTPDGSARPKYAYFPFGGGPRSCVGEPFAWLEAITLLATLAQRFRLTRADDSPVEMFPTITLRPKNAVRMTVHAR